MDREKARGRDTSSFTFLGERLRNENDEGSIASIRSGLGLNALCRFGKCVYGMHMGHLSVIMYIRMLWTFGCGVQPNTIIGAFDYTTKWIRMCFRTNRGSRGEELQGGEISFRT